MRQRNGKGDRGREEGRETGREGIKVRQGDCNVAGEERRQVESRGEIAC